MAVQINHDRRTDTLEIIVSDAPPRAAIDNADVNSTALRKAPGPLYHGDELLGFRVPNLSRLVSGARPSSARCTYNAVRDTLTVIGAADEGNWVTHDQRIDSRQLDILWSIESGEMIGVRLHAVSSLTTG